MNYSHMQWNVNDSLEFDCEWADLATALIRYLCSSRGVVFKPKRQNFVQMADMWLEREECDTYWKPGILRTLKLGMH